MYRIESPLMEVKLEDLRPTQMTVGFAEVDRKRKSWSDLKPMKRRAEMQKELFPAVKGPGNAYYILDHHHVALALLQEKSQRVAVGVARDLSQLEPEAFWIYLDHFSWVHPYDAKGQRRSFEDMPHDFQALEDDPYRSLVAQVLRSGGFAKPGEPFQEFLWANHFRARLPLKLVKGRPQKALDKALKLARSKDSAHLPGWPGKA